MNGISYSPISFRTSTTQSQTRFGMPFGDSKPALEAPAAELETLAGTQSVIDLIDAVKTAVTTTVKAYPSHTKPAQFSDGLDAFARSLIAEINKLAEAGVEGLPPKDAEYI